MNCKGVRGYRNLFSKYALHIKNMVNTMTKNEESLLSVINNLFVYSINPTTNKKQIRTNPTLTDSSLQIIVTDTRNLINKLYINCENNYRQGIQIYQQIVEEKIKETAGNQIENLDGKINQLNNFNANANVGFVQPSYWEIDNAKKLKVIEEDTVIEENTEINTISNTQQSPIQTPTENIVIPPPSPIETPTENLVLTPQPPNQTPTENPVISPPSPIETPTENLVIPPPPSPIETPTENLVISPTPSPNQTPTENPVIPPPQPPNQTPTENPVIPPPSELR